MRIFLRIFTFNQIYYKTLYEDCENDAGGTTENIHWKKKKNSITLTFFSYVVNTEHFIQ